MKAKITTLIALTFFITINNHANAQGHGVGGGGDYRVEGRIKLIRDNILSWINAGNEKSLTFSTDIDHQTYVYGDSFKHILGMRKVLDPRLGTVVVNVIKTEEENLDDPELNTWVDRMPKTCKRFVSINDQKLHILCNYERFLDQSEADQYRLIHHEYAGLAGVEQTLGSDSDYFFSNQITDQLKLESLLRLPVRPMELTAPVKLRTARISVLDSNDTSKTCHFTDARSMVLFDFNGELLIAKRVSGVAFVSIPSGPGVLHMSGMRFLESYSRCSTVKIEIDGNTDILAQKPLPPEIGGWDFKMK